MKNILFITALFSAVIFAVDTFASDKENTAEYLIAQILKTHPNIQSADMALRASGYAVDGAKWGYFPTPSVQVDQQGGKRSFTARLEQPIWTGGKIDAGVNIAKSQQKEAEQTLEETKYTLIERCIELIGSVIKFSNVSKVHQKALSRLENYNQMIKRRIEGGVSSLSDKQLIEARISQSKNDLKSAQTSKQIALEQLSILVGKKISDTQISSDLSVLMEQDRYADILSGAYATYPKVLKAAAKVQTARYNQDKVSSSLHPTVSIKAERQIDVFSSGYENNNGKIYISAQMSTGAGLAVLSQIQEAKLKTMEAKQLYEYEKMAINEKIASDYNAAMSIQYKQETARAGIDYADKVLASYTRLFLAGKRNWLDVVNAAREVTQNELEFYDISVSAFVYDKRLSLYKGSLIKNIGDVK